MKKLWTLHNDYFVLDMILDYQEAEIRAYPIIPFKGRLLVLTLVTDEGNNGAHITKWEEFDSDDIIDMYKKKLANDIKIGMVKSYDDNILHYLWNGKIIYTVHIQEDSDSIDIITSGKNDENKTLRLSNISKANCKGYDKNIIRLNVKDCVVTDIDKKEDLNIDVSN